MKICFSLIRPFVRKNQAQGKVSNKVYKLKKKSDLIFFCHFIHHAVPIDKQLHLSAKTLAEKVKAKNLRNTDTANLKKRRTQLYILHQSRVASVSDQIDFFCWIWLNPHLTRIVPVSHACPSRNRAGHGDTPDSHHVCASQLKTKKGIGKQNWKCANTLTEYVTTRSGDLKHCPQVQSLGVSPSYVSLLHLSTTTLSLRL